MLYNNYGQFDIMPSVLYKVKHGRQSRGWDGGDRSPKIWSGGDTNNIDAPQIPKFLLVVQVRLRHNAVIAFYPSPRFILSN